MLQIRSRRDPLTDGMVRDHMACMLTCIYELTLYSLYLKSSPGQEAALLVNTEHSPGLCSTQKDIMCRMQRTWRMVLAMEGSEDGNRILKQGCPHTRFVVFRETMSLLEEEHWQLNERTKALLCSWHPPVSMSANIEKIFNNMEDSCRRSSKNHTSCMSNLQCLAIRSVSQQMTSSTCGPTGVKLQQEDWEGKQIRGIKPSVWRTEAFSAGAYYTCIERNSTCAVYTLVQNN